MAVCGGSGAADRPALVKHDPSAPAALRRQVEERLFLPLVEDRPTAVGPIPVGASITKSGFQLKGALGPSKNGSQTSSPPQCPWPGCDPCQTPIIPPKSLKGLWGRVSPCWPQRPSR